MPIESVTGLPDEARLRAAYAVRDGVLRSIAPADPAVPFEQWAGYLRHVPRGRRQWHWLAHGGYATLVVDAESTLGQVGVFVAPSSRRRGLGSALLELIRHTATRAGCRRILGEFGDEAGAAFARAHGAVTGNTKIRSLLRLPVALREQPVPGFTLVSWTGSTPAELLDSYAIARNAITDAPHTGAGAEERWTAQLVRDLENAVAKRDRQISVTAALDGSKVAGFTELRVSAPSGSIASTEDTAVLRHHRGRGLATWLKATSLRNLQRDRPDVVAVRTANDITNAAMLAVNRQAGFREVGVWTDAVLALPAA